MNAQFEHKNNATMLKKSPCMNFYETIDHSTLYSIGINKESFTPLWVMWNDSYGSQKVCKVWLKFYTY